MKKPEMGHGLVMVPSTATTPFDLHGPEELEKAIEFYQIEDNTVAFVGFGEQKSKWGNVNSASVFQCSGKHPTLHCYDVPDRPIGTQGCCPLALKNRVATFTLGSKQK